MSEMLHIETGAGSIYGKDWEGIASLFAKIAKVTGSVGAIKETGKNRDQNYAYSSYNDVAAPLRRAISEARLGQVFHVREVSQASEGKGIRSHLVAEMILGDGDTGAFLVCVAHGEAMDYGTADKGINKAFTAAQKNALKRVFLVATSDDIEDDVDKTDKPQDDAERKPVAVGASHWINDTTRRASFWAWVEECGLTHEQAHEALDVPSLRDYGGTPAEAKAAIEKWIAANTEKTEG